MADREAYSKPMPEKRSTVLIVGAGPTGLMLACQLARLGVRCRIIDGKDGPTRESRALAVQARTLELYQGMGVAERALAEGYVVEAGNIYVGGERVQRLPLSEIGQGMSPFPLLLILEQSRNEALLYDALRKLGSEVNWNCVLVSFQQREVGVVVVLRHANGQEEQLTVDWLVGCDGACSPVREQLGLNFAGGTYENLFYVADTEVEWTLPRELTLCLSRETFVIFFPMTGKNRYRAIGILPRQFHEETELSFADIESSVRAQMDIPVRFSNPGWFSAYRVHHRCIERFRSGCAFLAGDAAHVHSPVGGQGMNTGLQDAGNLGWKLALVNTGRADPALLDSYHDERWPFAQRLLKSTDRGFRMVISQQPLIRAFRLRAFPQLVRWLVRIGRFRRFVFRGISQIGIRYHHSPLSRTSGRLSARAGERLPYAEVSVPLTAQTSSVYAWLAAPGFHLLLMQEQEAQLTAVAEAWRARLDAAYPGLFHVHSLTRNAGSAALFSVLGVRDCAVLLVRPDQYLAYVATRFDWDAFARYLRECLHLRPAYEY